jgi:hypothetical protein
VNRGNQLDELDFHDDLVFDHQIGPESGVDADLLIEQAVPPLLAYTFLTSTAHNEKARKLFLKMPSY